jgi:hypothetical protein
MLHNTIYSILVEQLVKPSKNELYSMFRDKKEPIKGIEFRTIEEIDFEQEPEEFLNFKIYKYSSKINNNIFIINYRGTAIFLSTDSGNKNPFILSTFNDFQQTNTEIYKNINSLEKIGKLILIQSEEAMLEEAEEEFYKEIINDMSKHPLHGFIFNKIKEGRFEYILNNSEKILEKKINFNKLKKELRKNK